MNVERLERIKQHVLEEPRRANMYDWARVSPETPCGTAGCIAGWDELMDLKHPQRSKLMQLARDYQDGDASFWELGEYVRPRAARRLGLDDEQADRLFDPEEWPEALKESLFAHRPGTAAHAKIIAERIDLFIATEGRK